MEEGHKKFLIISAIFFCVAVLILLISTLVPKTVIPVEENPNVSVPISEPVAENPPQAPEPKVEMATYTNPTIPTFKVNYPDNLTVTVKKFDDPETTDFKSKYFGGLNCGRNCMGIRFSNNTFKLDLILDAVFDGGGNYCSNSVTTTELKNGWIRIKSSVGYLYRKQVEYNKSTGPNVYQGDPGLDSVYFGNPLSDEWSYQPNTTYKICYSGIGSILGDIPVSESHPFGGGLLFENVTLPLLTTEKDLRIVDSIIESIIY